MDPLNDFSIVKQFALRTLECFDEIAKPEIKNSVMVKIWNYLKGYTFKKILKKPDQELKETLYKVYCVLGPLFKDLDISNEIKAGELLGSPKIPDVGEMAKVKPLAVDHTAKILKELGFS